MQTVDAGTSKSSLDQASEQTDLPDLASRFSCQSSRVLGECELDLEPSCQANLFIKDNCSICSCVWFSEKEPTCNAGATGDLGSNPWVGKIPWRTAWKPTPVFLPGESHGQRSLVGYSPWGRKELDMTEVSDFIFLSSKITADGDCSHEIKWCLFLGKLWPT